MAVPNVIITYKKRKDKKKKEYVEIDDRTARMLRGKYGEGGSSSFPSPYDIPPFFLF